MKLYAPKYYKKFKCIADKCEKSCCIGWEIDIDKSTYEKYKSLKNGYAPTILNSISLEETPHFKLCAGDKCPHLNEKGLCEIIINLGEDYLSHICREHPRFYNYTNVAEVGLGMSCIEAARLILSSPDYYAFEEVGKVEAVEEQLTFDALCHRKKIYNILQDRSVNYNSRLEAIYNNYNIDLGDDTFWIEIIERLEYLDASHREMFLSYSSKKRPDGFDEYLERALAYFIYRHCAEALDEEDFCSRLTFCLFCERLLASLICFNNAKTLQEIAILSSIISEEIEYSEDNTASLMY